MIYIGFSNQNYRSIISNCLYYKLLVEFWLYIVPFPLQHTPTIFIENSSCNLMHCIKIVSHTARNMEKLMTHVLNIPKLVGGHLFPAKHPIPQLQTKETLIPY